MSKEKTVPQRIAYGIKPAFQESWKVVRWLGAVGLVLLVCASVFEMALNGLSIEHSLKDTIAGTLLAIAIIGSVGMTLLGYGDDRVKKETK